MATYYLFSFSVLCTLLFMFISPSHSIMNDNNVDYNRFERPYFKKVNVSLYYESLDSYCANFIVNQLGKIFDTHLDIIVNLRLVPWGNARLSDSNKIVCQNGEAECYLNTVAACAIKAWPATRKHFEFIRCIERVQSVIKDLEQTWKQCINATGFAGAPIQSCFDTGEGLKLLRAYGEETAHLNPAHQYVPWVTVDGKPLYKNYPDFRKIICKKLKGKSKPKPCKLLSEVSTDEKENTAAPFRYPVTQKMMKTEPSA